MVIKEEHDTKKLEWENATSAIRDQYTQLENNNRELKENYFGRSISIDILDEKMNVLNLVSGLLDDE